MLRLIFLFNVAVLSLFLSLSIPIIFFLFALFKYLKKHNLLILMLKGFICWILVVILTQPYLKADILAEAFRSGFAATKCPAVKGRLAVEMVTCIGTLAESGNSWRKVYAELLEDEAVMTAVSSVLRSSEAELNVSRKALAILSKQPDRFLNQGEPVKPTVRREIKAGTTLSAEESAKLDQRLEDLRLATERLNVEEEERLLPEVLQLQMYLGQKEGAECRLLRADLEAADERLRNKNWLIETQEELPDDAKTTIFC